MALGEQFRYEPRIKNKPNAQGTLFQAPASMRTPRSRQPRGYSPERMQEVRDTLANHRIDTIVGDHGRQFAPAQLHQTIARSTVPMSDLPKQMHWGLNHPMYGEHAGNALAEYFGPTDYDPPKIMIGKGGEASSDALHELGHANSDVRKLPHRTYGTPVKKGQEEGYAENYAQTHFRKPGYKERGMPSIKWEDAVDESTGWSYREPTQSRRDTFEHAYISKRMEHPANAVPEINPEQFNYGEHPLIYKETPPRGSDLPVGWTYNPNVVNNE